MAKPRPPMGVPETAKKPATGKKPAAGQTPVVRNEAVYNCVTSGTGDSQLRDGRQPVPPGIEDRVNNMVSGVKPVVKGS